MKVIDLIMRKHNGDEMPKTVIINNCQYEYDDKKRKYVNKIRMHNFNVPYRR